MATDQDQPPFIGIIYDQCMNLTVLSQCIKMNHYKSYVRTFMSDITDKTFTVGAG